MPWSFYNSTGDLTIAPPVGGVPLGDITPFTGAMSGALGSVAQAESAPEGYLFCNGAAVSRSDYAGLFSSIGTTYGVGDGSTTFNLPNLLDYFVKVRANETIGAMVTGGSATHSHTSVSSHFHSIADHVHTFSDAHDHFVGTHSHAFPAHQHSLGSVTTGNPSATNARNVGGPNTRPSSAHSHGITGLLFDGPAVPPGVSGVALLATADATFTPAVWSGAQQTTSTSSTNSDSSTAVTFSSSANNLPPYFGATYIIKAVNV